MHSYVGWKRRRRSKLDRLQGCPGQDLNLHALRRCHLKAVRLPIPPPGLFLEARELYARLSRCREWNDPAGSDQKQAPAGLGIDFVSAGESAEGGKDRAAFVEDETGCGDDRAVVIRQINRRMHVAGESGKLGIARLIVGEDDAV